MCFVELLDMTALSVLKKKTDTAIGHLVEKERATGTTIVLTASNPHF